VSLESPDRDRVSARQRLRSISAQTVTPVRMLAAHPAARIVTALVSVIAIVAILRPPSRSEFVFDPEQLGQIASEDVAATHYFELDRADPDDVAAAARAAEATVLPVWDYHPERLDETLGAVRGTFDRIRARLRQEAVVRATELQAAQAVEGSVVSALPEIDEASLMMVLTVADRVRVAQNDGAFSLLLGTTPMPEADQALRAMAADGFSFEAEEALVTLITGAMSRQIIADRSLLDGLSVDGLTLRTIEAGAVTQERSVRNFRDFFSTAEIDDLVYAASVRVRAERDGELMFALVQLANQLSRANTELNTTETAARRSVAALEAEQRFVSQQRVKFRPGERIVSRGEVISPDVLAALAQMSASAAPTTRSAWPLIGLAGLVILWIGPVFEFSRRNLGRFSVRPRDVAMMATVLVLHLGLSRLSLFICRAVVEGGASFALDALILLTPFATGAILVRVLTNAENALAYSVVYATLCGILHDQSLSVATYSLISGIAAITAVDRARSRTEVIRAGIVAGVLLAAIAAALVMIAGDPVGLETLHLVGGALLSGVISAAVATAVLPMLEGAFRYTTALRLMELANLNHPALRDLVMKAPGTYHHSMMVGQLVEAACESVGADALLGRVGAYFHDIGKSKNPAYFAENQSGSNPHNRLKPHMSALVIRAHVKDGVEMARQYGLPERIVDFIREHHGTSRIGYFYQKALDEGGEVDEGSYRYPGPRPQSRETAICLLADGVEAASRALPDPSPRDLKALVQKMIDRAQADGQLDDCDLTIRELNTIGKAFLMRLTAFYHHRPEYPDARGEKEKQPRIEPNERWVSDLERGAENLVSAADDSRVQTPKDRRRTDV
jgi:putative nucleotidyltransferase with HDIG domain